MSVTKEELRQFSADAVARAAYGSYDDASLDELMRYGLEFEKSHPADPLAPYMNRALAKLADQREQMRQQTTGGDR